MPNLIVIGGPTASGKTSLAASLAKQLNTVVVSADSRQFYQEMSIGTAKPTLEEMQEVVHYFIGSHSIHNELTAASYATEANALLTNLFKTHNNVILVGGSGMYIDALCNGLHDIPASPELRNQLTEEWKTEGLDKLLSELASCDTATFNQIDLKNPVRVIRALEVFRLTGLPLSSFKRAQQAAPDFDVIRFVIDLPRNELYDRINQRVDLMIENGLIGEVNELMPYKDFTSLNTVGYKEIIDYLEGKYSLDEAIEKVKLNSRRYAKRQLTWFRRHKESIWIAPNEFNEIMEKCTL
jgi:tRNA dimethylallyltransferase